MTEQQDKTPDGEDIELLLPWLATGRLTDTQAARFESALDGDPELRRRFGLVQDEQDETVRLNEALSVPSSRLAAQLFARIDAEPARSPAPLRLGTVLDRLRKGATALFTAPRPWVAATAAIIIVAQAGGLAYLARHHGPAPATYQTASGPEAESAPGRLALVGFVPGASLGDIAQLLEKSHVSIVDGPRGGLFTLRIGDDRLPDAEAEKVLAALRSNSALVTFAAPKE